MKDPNFITRQILDFRLKKPNDPIEEACLVQQFFSAGRFYVVADTATTKEDWEARKFGIHTEHRAIHLFLERTDAHQKAISIQSVLPDNSSMVFPITSEVALSLISDYAHKDIISAVWLCGKSPVTAKVGLNSLLRNFRNQSSSTIMSDSLYGKLPSLDVGESTHLKSHSEKKEFNLISEVRQVLNLSSAEERRKLDPSDSYTNLSRLLEKLIRANGLDMTSLDEILALPIGFTSNLCNSQRSDVIPKAKVKAYLQYFGLSEYLYVFKSQCAEIAQELEKSDKIDPYEIKPASIKTVERFTLSEIVRGKDMNDAFVYRITFKSGDRDVVVISSSNFKMIEGKEYELVGLTPLETSLPGSISIKNAADNKLCPLPSQDDMDRAMAASIPRHKGMPTQKQGSSTQEKRDSHSTGKNRYIAETAEEKLKKNRDAVISYIIKTSGCSSRDAMRKMAPFEGHEDVIASFAAWIDQKKGNNFAVRGYTPKKLMHSLKYSPYDAFCILVDLIENPKDTLQRLKYRETDPQYQRIPKESDPK